MRNALLLAAFLLSFFAFAEVTSVRRGKYTVTFNNCPTCPMRMRLADDGRQAFINVARVTNERERARMIERAFAFLTHPERLTPPEQGGDPTVRRARRARPTKTELYEVSVWTQKEDSAVFVRLSNPSNAPLHDVALSLSRIGVKVPVQVFDITERADRGVFTDEITLSLAPRSTRFLRLDQAETANGNTARLQPTVAR